MSDEMIALVKRLLLEHGECGDPYISDVCLGSYCAWCGTDYYTDHLANCAYQLLHIELFGKPSTLGRR